MGAAFFKGLLASGAPWGFLCAALAYATIALWRRNNLLSDRLYALATKQVEVNTETRITLQGVRADVESMSRRFEHGKR